MGRIYERNEVMSSIQPCEDAKPRFFTRSCLVHSNFMLQILYQFGQNQLTQVVVDL